MSATQITTSFNIADLESLIRRAVREELATLLRKPAGSILEDWKQEGPEDSLGDDVLLRDALGVLQQCENTPEAWMRWEDFEAELDRVEANGELRH